MDHIPETTIVDTPRVWCDGAGDIRGGENYLPVSLGHPRVYMQIDEKGYVDCGYCDRRFILEGGVADDGNVPDAASPVSIPDSVMDAAPDGTGV